jgi:hypothetical protein
VETAAPAQARSCSGLRRAIGANGAAGNAGTGPTPGPVGAAAAAGRSGLAAQVARAAALVLGAAAVVPPQWTTVGAGGVPSPGMVLVICS